MLGQSRLACCPCLGLLVALSLPVAGCTAGDAGDAADAGVPADAAAPADSADPPEPPPAIVGDADSFGGASVQPEYADDSHLYFYYHASFFDQPVLGPEQGLYRIALAGGEPTLLVPGRVWSVRRAGEDLVMLAAASDDEAATLTTLPRDGSGPSSQVPLAPGARGFVISGGFTFILYRSSGDGQVSITRLATEAEAERTVAIGSPTYIDGDALYADGAYLFWYERDEGLMRIADDLTKPTPEQLAGPQLDYPIEGERDLPQHSVLGVIGDEVLLQVYQESFFATGGNDDYGRPNGVQDFGGGAVYSISTDGSGGRIVAKDLRMALIHDEQLYAQTRHGDSVRVDLQSGELTLLQGRAQKFTYIQLLATNGQSLFYTDYDQRALPGADTFWIRYVSLAAAE